MTQPTKLRIWCDICNGTGNKYPNDSDYSECPSCKGLGYTEQLVPKSVVKGDFEYSCPYCKKKLDLNSHDLVEPLEVLIKKDHPEMGYFTVCYIHNGNKNILTDLIIFNKYLSDPKQKAIDWCKQKGLKVKD